MRLLVSVATADDARAAVEGGADIVDAKNPDAGALGAVTLDRLREIRDAIGGARPLSAALGEAADEHALVRNARAYAEAGATLVKIGFFGTRQRARAESLLAAAVDALSTTPCGVVAVAYADADLASSLPPDTVVEAAARGGARGVLIDTIDKQGPGLLGVMSPSAVIRWVSAGHAAGLLVAVAGKLSASDMDVIRNAGADVAGVRGAACVGGRTGRVSAELVRQLAGLRYPSAENEGPPPRVFSHR